MTRRAMATVEAMWAASRPLTAVGLGLLPVLGLTLAGLAVDGRLIQGEPAWLKPAKFAASIAAYCLTLAWFFAMTGRPSRLLQGLGAVVAWSLAFEMAIIAGQAARGTSSHFNRATPLDAALFGAMGLAIVALVAASAGAAVGLWRSTYDDRAVGWAVRLGMAATVVGASTGGFMLRPTAAQVAAARPDGSMPRLGAHTVGGPDGAAGLPVVGWSRDRGDLRAPHFAGLHAMQAIPILSALLIRAVRARRERTRLGLVATVAAGYLALIALLMARALGGRPVVAPDAADVARFATLALVAASAVALLAWRDRAGTTRPILAWGA